MKATVAVTLVAVLVCFLCSVLDYANAVPADKGEVEIVQNKPVTFFDKIFNIPRSVIGAVNKNLNERGAKCPDGSPPVNIDGKGTCHDNALGISKSALDSVNDFLNGH